AGRWVGSYIVSRTLAGTALGSLGSRFVATNLLVISSAGALGVLAADGLFYLFAPQPGALRWLKISLGEAAANAAIAAVVGIMWSRCGRRGRREMPRSF